MQGLYVLPFEHDSDALAATFFSNETPEKEELWQGDWVKQSGGQRLSLAGSLLVYTNELGYATPNFIAQDFRDETNRRRLADAFVEMVAPNGLEFAFSHEMEWDEETYRMYFRGSFDGYVLRNNSIRLTIRENGITRAEIRFVCVPYAFSGHSREVFSADEALFAVLREQLAPRFSGHTVTITNIEMGYHLSSPISADGDFLAKAIPCYKIIVDIDGFIEVYWVDAYTAVVR
jgi:hypothetical protein